MKKQKIEVVGELAEGATFVAIKCGNGDWQLRVRDDEPGPDEGNAAAAPLEVELSANDEKCIEKYGLNRDAFIKARKQELDAVREAAT